MNASPSFGRCTCNHAVYDHARTKFSGNTDHSYVACRSDGCPCLVFTASDGSRWPDGTAGQRVEAA